MRPIFVNPDSANAAQAAKGNTAVATGATARAAVVTNRNRVLMDAVLVNLSAEKSSVETMVVAEPAASVHLERSAKRASVYACRSVTELIAWKTGAAAAVRAVMI